MEDWRSVMEKLVENQEEIISVLKEKEVHVPQKIIRLEELFMQKSNWWD